MQDVLLFSQDGNGRGGLLMFRQGGDPFLFKLVDLLPLFLEEEGAGRDLLFETFYFPVLLLEPGGEGSEVAAPAGQRFFEAANLPTQGEGAFLPPADPEEPGRKKHISLRSDEVQGGLPQPELDGRRDIPHDESVAESVLEIGELRARPKPGFHGSQHGGIGDHRRGGSGALLGRDQDIVPLKRLFGGAPQEIQGGDDGKPGLFFPEGVDEHRVTGIGFDELGQPAESFRDRFLVPGPEPALLHLF